MKKLQKIGNNFPRCDDSFFCSFTAAKESFIVSTFWNESFQI